MVDDAPPPSPAPRKRAAKKTVADGDGTPAAKPARKRAPRKTAAKAASTGDPPGLGTDGTEPPKAAPRKRAPRKVAAPKVVAPAVAAAEGRAPGRAASSLPGEPVDPVSTGPAPAPPSPGPPPVRRPAGPATRAPTRSADATPTAPATAPPAEAVRAPVIARAASMPAAAGAVHAPASRQAPAANPAQSPRARGPAAASTPTATGRRPDLQDRLRHGLRIADPYLRLCRLDRPIGMLLLLWPTWWALWAAAEGVPPIGLLLIFTLGVVLMRSAGCVINDYADRWLDPKVERTRDRPLATGEVTPRQALALFAGLLAAAFLLVLLTNRLTVQLAFVGAVLAATYPLLKRYTHLPQVYLGVAFGWSIPMAFAAVTGGVPVLAWLLFLANILWTTAYDTWYAMVDREDDIKAGAKSTAILLGDTDLVAIGMMQALFVLAMAFVGQRLLLGWPYWLGLAVACALLAWQMFRARDRSREACFRAFLDNNWVGMALFLGLAIGLALRS